jgi:hypothetical protein
VQPWLLSPYLAPTAWTKMLKKRERVAIYHVRIRMGGLQTCVMYCLHTHNLNWGHTLNIHKATDKISILKTCKLLGRRNSDPAPAAPALILCIVCSFKIWKQLQKFLTKILKLHQIICSLFLFLYIIEMLCSVAMPGTPNRFSLGAEAVTRTA